MQAPEEVLASIPGWSDAILSELSGGLNNRIWRVIKGSKCGVLKIDDEPRGAPFSSRHDEAHVQKMAWKEGLAPQVIFAENGFYFTEFAEGVVWTRDYLNKMGNLELVASALKRLHALPLTGRLFDASAAAKRYIDELKVLESDVAQKCFEIITKMRSPLNLCCCHNDLVVANIITSPKLMFLDWEYSSDNDPFFDLATIIEHHELSDQQVTIFLDAYMDGDGQCWRGHLDKQRRMYLALYCLWMGSRLDSDPAELDSIILRLAKTTSCF
ncbi:MAG: phosphotransferase family protein [Woeseiaceae bacterium]|jgi:thiamine kinase-like enzyme|nr:phosphotransferase family protein [Woeseiaceae bacterium]